MDAYRRAVIRWRDENKDGKLPNDNFNPGDLLDWAKGTDLSDHLKAEGIFGVEPGLTDAGNAWNYDEVVIHNHTDLASVVA